MSPEDKNGLDGAAQGGRVDEEAVHDDATRLDPSPPVPDDATRLDPSPPVPDDATRLDPSPPVPDDATRLDPSPPVPDDAPRMEQDNVSGPSAVASENDGLTPGTVLIHTYRIEDMLKRGGMGEVYRVTHINLSTELVIKVIRPEMANDPKIVELFRREASTLRNVRDDAVVAYEGFFSSAEGHLYLVMEFVRGAPLSDLIGARTFTGAELQALLSRLASGLAVCHAKGVIHRDISPDNVLLPDGKVEQAKIIDFGIARDGGHADGTVIGDNFAGKYAFAAPEQLGLFGGGVDARSDIYSLGLVIAALALGGQLNKGASLIDLMEMRRTVPDLDGVPREIRATLTKMLQPDPAQRAQTMEELVQNDGYQHSAVTDSRGEAKATKSRRGLMLTAASFLIGAVLAGGGYYLKYWDLPDSSLTTAQDDSSPIFTPEPPSSQTPSPQPSSSEPPSFQSASVGPKTASPGSNRPVPKESEPLPDPQPEAMLPASRTEPLVKPAQPRITPSVQQAPPPVQSRETSPAQQAPPAVQSAQPRVTSSVQQAPPAVQPRVTSPVQKAPPAVQPRVTSPAQFSPSSVQPRVTSPVQQAPPAPQPRITTPARPVPEQPKIAMLPPAGKADVEPFLRSFSCARLKAVAGSGVGGVMGFVSSESDLRRLRSTTAANYAGFSDTSNVAVRRWPYCETILALEDYTRTDLPSTSGFRVRLNHPNLLYRDGDRFELNIDTPIDGPRYLYVAYMNSDGSVARIYPPPGSSGETRIGQKITLGSDGSMTIGEPYGHDMIIAIATDAPLGPQIGNSERARDFLTALTASFAKSRGAVRAQSVSLFITTMR